MADKSFETPQVAQEENVYQRRKRRSCAGHCLRFWWAYLIALIIIVLVVVLPVIFVAVPHIIQQRLDGATITLANIVLSNDEPTTYHLAINSSLTADDSIKADISSFEAVMYLEDWEPQTPFVSVTFPAVSVEAFQWVNISQPVTVPDLNAWTIFNTWLLQNETLRVTILGYPTVYVHGISRGYGATFKKTITMPALNNFTGSSVPESTVQLTPDANGDNFFGTVTVPNPSPITFEVGNVSFYNFLNGSYVGMVYIDDMTLHSGTTNYTMRANVNQTFILNTIKQRPYCETGVLPLAIQAANVTKGSDRIAYYADSLGTINQSVPINIGLDLKKQFNLSIACT